MSEQLHKKTVSQINTLDEIADNVAIKSDDEINRLIEETEETLTALMDELKSRQANKMHNAIDNLDAHMTEADSSFKALRSFVNMALQELRKKDS
ncbi:hypothetical protein VH441_09085 [Psychrobacter sp. HD31]|uniref:hypothetical protein n=1 Tax=Psychrobacter sp. HD31 TaxID=3112003 RepID=UPI003DA5BEB5